jgi:hypothetical protein
MCLPLFFEQVAAWHHGEEGPLRTVNDYPAPLLVWAYTGVPSTRERLRRVFLRDASHL